jgi:hypothetical protein
MDQSTRIRRREDARRRVRRQRRMAGGLALLVGALVIALLVGGSGSTPGERANAASKTPPAPPQLPRGGRVIFPGNRVVAYYGAPQDAKLGELGIGTPAQAAAKLERQARRYRRGPRPVLPAFELIATVASGAPGPASRYSDRQPGHVIDRYLAAARRAKALLILDIQPGHVDWMTDVQALRPYLEQPDVSLALDPEWKVPAGQIPGKVIGSTDATEVNSVAAYLAAIVRERNLPQKLLVVHQFTDNMIRNKPLLVQPPGVALTLNVDGFGDQPNKVAKYVGFTHVPGTRRFHSGFKLFFHEDTGLMSPGQVLRLRPQPELIVYE